MEILYAAIGLIIGFFLHKFIFEKNYVSKDKHVELTQNQHITSVRLETELKKSNELQSEILALRKQTETKFYEISDLNMEIASLRNEQKNLTEKIKTIQTEKTNLSNTLSTEFSLLANKILEENSKKLSDSNTLNIKQLLEPLGVNITEFKKKVEETYDRESKERFSLTEKIKELAELNLKISTEANNLTRALKGDNKVQGDWGEMILENILENSGLEKGREYHVQEFLKDAHGKPIHNIENNKKFQPDVIISYPDNRKIIIDSKVSLTAYETYINAQDDETKRIAVQQHIKSVKTHIDNLHAKKYYDYADDSLDFVMMFIPIEPAYLDAVRNDPTLWDYAYKKRIILISPTNLIAALKLIHDLWKREKQNQNAMEIAQRGGKLYDKFVNFTEKLKSVGEQLDKTQKTYDDAMKQLTTGNDNLVRQAEKLRKLGIKSEKTTSIPYDETENE